MYIFDFLENELKNFVELKLKEEIVTVQNFIQDQHVTSILFKPET
jgi:hypothetical protein